ncbi:endonuclease MutS2 [Candidatus Latescibacterota bacterium]
MNEHALQVLEFPQVIDILADFATSELGKKRVSALMPLADMAQTERRMAETTELKALLMPARDLPIGGLRDLSFILQELGRGVEVLLVEQILTVADTLRAARRVSAYLGDAEETYPHVALMAEDIGLFGKLEERIDATFNEGGGIKNSASSVLKTARNEIQTLRGRIRGKLSALMRSPGVAPHLQDTGIREHDGRPTLAVRAAAASRVRGAQRGRSSSGGTVFVEPEGVRQMGDDLAEALNREKAEMQRLLREITTMISEQAARLQTTMAALAHVDMTYAKVRMSRAFSMEPPRLNAEGVIHLVGARHPLLLDLQRRDGIDEVVAIDVRLGDDFHTLVITGPNTGGKTVALKTMGLLTLMAMTGMHVPADAASTLPVLSEVWADIGDEQSIEQSLSTFSGHLTQVGQILHGADAHSLVLLDELGGGTDPAEGAALARAILEYLHEQGVRTAVTTHISQLKTLGYTLAGVENASIEFDVDTLKPTYKVLIGRAGSSNALALARRLGLPEAVIAEAEERRQGDGPAQLLNELQAAREQTLADREEAQLAHDEVRQLREEVRRTLADTRAQEELLKTSNGQAAYETLRSLKARAEHLRRDEPSKRSLLLALGELVATIDKELARAPDVGVGGSPKVGDRVHVRSLGRAGVLNHVDTRTGRAVVDLGAAPVTVALAEVEAV